MSLMKIEGLKGFYCCSTCGKTYSSKQKNCGYCGSTQFHETYMPKKSRTIGRRGFFGHSAEHAENARKGRLGKRFVRAWMKAGSLTSQIQDYRDEQERKRRGRHG